MSFVGIGVFLGAAAPVAGAAGAAAAAATAATVGIAATTAAVGIGTAVYGADKQRKLTNQTNDRNAAMQQSANDTAQQNFLATKGVGPNGEAVNTKLPYWATANFARRTGPVQSRWRKRGSGPGSLVKMSQVYQPAQPDYSANPPAQTQPGRGQTIKNILDPLNVTVGNNRNNFFDPLGIF